LTKPDPAESTMSPFSPEAAVAVMSPPSRMLAATPLLDTIAANTWLALVVPFRVRPGVPPAPSALDGTSKVIRSRSSAPVGAKVTL
jgi:hypothetical protein